MNPLSKEVEAASVIEVQRQQLSDAQYQLAIAAARISRLEEMLQSLSAETAEKKEG